MVCNYSTHDINQSIFATIFAAHHAHKKKTYSKNRNVENRSLTNYFSTYNFLL